MRPTAAAPAAAAGGRQDIHGVECQLWVPARGRRGPCLGSVARLQSWVRGLMTQDCPDPSRSASSRLDAVTRLQDRTQSLKARRCPDYLLRSASFTARPARGAPTLHLLWWKIYQNLFRSRRRLWQPRAAVMKTRPGTQISDTPYHRLMHPTVHPGCSRGLRGGLLVVLNKTLHDHPLSLLN